MFSFFSIFLLALLNGDLLQINTPNLYSYNYTILSTNLRSLVFTVQASNDAHISLASQIINNYGNYWEIVLGGWANTKSCIRSCSQCYCLVDYVGTVLDPNSSRQLWVSWNYTGSIVVGTGNVVGSNVILSFAYSNKLNYVINYIGFATGWGSTGYWTTNVDSSSIIGVTAAPSPTFNPTLTMYTSNLYSYNNTLFGISDPYSTINSIRFQVRGSSNAHIALKSQKNSTDIWEIILGAWTNSVSCLRSCAQCACIENLTDSVLSSVNYNPFWISWNYSNFIMVGKGNNVGSNIMMSTIYQSNKFGYIINYIGFSSGFGSDGDWKIEAPDSNILGNFHQLTNTENKECQGCRKDLFAGRYLYCNGYYADATKSGCAWDGSDCTFAPIQTVSTLQYCEQLCQQEPGCNYITYYSSISVCNLFLMKSCSLVTTTSYGSVYAYNN